MKRITMVAGLALAFSGCTADFATQNSADVLLIVAAVNGGTPLRSDVLGTGDTVAGDTVDLAVAIRNKNTNTGVPVPNYRCRPSSSSATRCATTARTAGARRVWTFPTRSRAT